MVRIVSEVTSQPTTLYTAMPAPPQRRAPRGHGALLFLVQVERRHE